MLCSLDFRSCLKANKPNRFQAFAVNPRRFFRIFSLENKTSTPDVFCSCSFIARAHFETS